MKKSLAAVVSAAILTCGVSAFAASQHFADIPEADTALQKASDYLYEKNCIIDGFGDKMLHPDNNITRAEFAKILTDCAEVYGFTTAEKDYSDVTSDHWAYTTINKCAYFNGFEDGTFRPDEELTNSQAITSIVRLIGKENEAMSRYSSPESVGLTGAPSEAYPTGYVTAAHAYGLTKNVGSISLDAPATRRTAVILTYNAVSYLEQSK